MDTLDSFFTNSVEILISIAKEKNDQNKKRLKNKSLSIMDNIMGLDKE